MDLKGVYEGDGRGYIAYEPGKVQGDRSPARRYTKNTMEESFRELSVASRSRFSEGFCKRIRSLRNAPAIVATFVIVCLLALGAGTAFSATLPPGFVDTDVSGVWDGAVGITFDQAGTMYQWDRDGRVWIYEDDIRETVPLIDISEEVGNWGDHGLLGFALDPHFLE